MAGPAGRGIYNGRGRPGRVGLGWVWEPEIQCGPGREKGRQQWAPKTPMPLCAWAACTCMRPWRHTLSAAPPSAATYDCRRKQSLRLQASLASQGSYGGHVEALSTCPCP